MYADDTTAAGPSATFVTVGDPIIAEVTQLGKQLVIVLEVELIKPASS